MMRSLIIVVPLAAVGILNIWCGQTQSGVAEPAFEVVSIRRHVPVGLRSPLDAYKKLINPGTLSMSATSVGNLIDFAYDLKSSAEIQGDKPEWLTREYYDVIAKTSSPVSTDQLKLMTQTLLANRFGFRCHKETKEGPMYALVLGKSLRLTPAADEETPEFNSQPIHTRLGDEIIFTYVEKKISLAQVADWLSSRFRRLVVDKTGIQGMFSFALKVTADQAMSNEEFINAIHEQLGLKVEPQRGPVESLIIEHIERPSEN